MLHGLEQPIDDVDSENVYLAQFGGTIDTADYVIVLENQVMKRCI